MPVHELTLVTRVKGAVQAAGDIDKVGSAIDRVKTKAQTASARIGGFAASAGNFIQRSGLATQALYYGGQLGADVMAGSNAGAGPQGIAGNVLGGAAAGASIAGPVGAAAGIAAGVVKSAAEIGQSTSAQAAEIGKAGDAMIATKPSLDSLNTSIAAIDKGLADLQSNGLNFFLGGGDAAKKLTELKQKYEEQRQTLLQEGSDTERALRQNAYSIVAAINGLDLSVNVNVPVSVRTEGVTSVTYSSGITSTNSYRGDPGYGRA